jgi:hypothetical protein
MMKQTGTLSINPQNEDRVSYVFENNCLTIGPFTFDIDELRDHLHLAYSIVRPDAGYREPASFSDTEKRKLRPIAETLAMLDGNAFFGHLSGNGQEWYEMYLGEADALYQANGGDQGWAGEASFAKRKIQETDPSPNGRREV